MAQHALRAQDEANARALFKRFYVYACMQEEDDFICKVAMTPREIQELIENGFEYICDLDNLKFFRKRK